MSIEIKNISKQFGQTHILNDINLNIETNELVALLGPSGCGKTTLLRILAGLEQANAGQVLFSGEDKTHIHTRFREVGFVFQHYALFKHMTVFENIAFGLRVKDKSKRLSDSEINQKVKDLLSIIQLDNLGNRYPKALSGGQKQRVALARALAIDPKVLLLDEPFSALDAKVRKELRQWVKELHQKIPVTTVFVTHDQDEAIDVADKIVLLSHGKIENIFTPAEYSNYII